MTFQRKTLKYLKALTVRDELDGEVKPDIWYKFVDEHGLGFCQPDIELHYPEGIICIECKLTQTQNAHEQIDQLYRPVLEEVYGKKVYGIQATKTLMWKPEQLVYDIVDFIYAEQQKDEAVWLIV